MKGRLDAFSTPAEGEGFVEASLHVFWEVTTTGGWLFVDHLLDEVNIFGEVGDVEPVTIFNIAISDKTDSDGQTFV